MEKKLTMKLNDELLNKVIILLSAQMAETENLRIAYQRAPAKPPFLEKCSRKIEKWLLNETLT